MTHRHLGESARSKFRIRQGDDFGTRIWSRDPGHYSEAYISVLALLGANRSLGPKNASNDEGERRNVEQPDSADERVDSGGTDQKRTHDEGWSRVGPSDHGETADEGRSNDEDRLRI